MKENSKKETVCPVKLPEGRFCGYNCAQGCIYWEPYKKDFNGRQHCSYYGHYYYPSERQGCLSFKR